MGPEIKPTHHDEDERGTIEVKLQHGQGFKAVTLPERRIAATGHELWGFLSVSNGHDLFGVPKGYVEDFRVEADDVVCLLCTEHFYTFPREVNGG